MYEAMYEIIWYELLEYWLMLAWSLLLTLPIWKSWSLLLTLPIWKCPPVWIRVRDSRQSGSMACSLGNRRGQRSAHTTLCRMQIAFRHVRHGSSTILRPGHQTGPNMGPNWKLKERRNPRGMAPHKGRFFPFTRWVPSQELGWAGGFMDSFLSAPGLGIKLGDISSNHLGWLLSRRIRMWRSHNSNHSHVEIGCDGLTRRLRSSESLVPFPRSKQAPCPIIPSHSSNARMVNVF